MALPERSTERLWLRPLAVEDAEALHGAYADPACMRYWGEEPAADVEATRARVARVVAGALRWWTDVLGFRVGFVYGDPPTHAAVLADVWVGSARLQLTQRAPGDAGGSSVYVVSGDVDGLAARAEAAGATVVTPLGKRPWGAREVELADTDGNRIRVGSG